MLTTHPTLARAQGLEIDASPFLRSEVERFEAWNLKQAAVMGIDKLSDEELLERYHQLQTKIVESFETEGNRDGIES